MNMRIEERMDLSETVIFKTVFPDTTNHHDTLFGGRAMAMMDEIAFIAATRFCRKRLVTVSSDKIDFTKAIPAGSIIELVARVIHVGRTSLKVQVDIFIEQMYQDGREKAISGSFTLVAIDAEKKPVSVLEGLGIDV